MDQSFFTKQLEDIITSFYIINSKSTLEDLSDRPASEITMILTRSKAAVARIAGEKSEYFKDIESTLKREHLYVGIKLQHVIGCVMALKSDLEKDYLRKFSDIIQSEVFFDYLEMAEHLLREGYKDPSAVLAGSTLEVHLRELCTINGIPIEVTNNRGDLVPKKADVMNADLAKAGVYSSAYQKQIIAWLGLRNSAAHGKYSEYSAEEINLMLQGVRQFILVTK